MGVMQVATRIWLISCTIYFSFMNPSSSWKRSHIATGSTPNKPSEKRQSNGNRGARKPLDFSSENIENSEQTVTEKSPFRSPRHKGECTRFITFNLKLTTRAGLFKARFS